jgi:hypothetical protein
MADNLNIKDGVGNPVVKATKDIGAGVQLEKVLLTNDAGVPLTALPVTLPVDQTVVVSGAVTVSGTAAVSLAAPVVAVSRLNDDAGAVALPKFAAISASASGLTSVVAAVTGKRIRVLNYVFMAGAAGTVTFRGLAGPLTGAFPVVANSGAAANAGPHGLFQTAVGEALSLDLSAAFAVAGHITYIEV